MLDYIRTLHCGLKALHVHFIFAPDDTLEEFSEGLQDEVVNSSEDECPLDREMADAKLSIISRYYRSSGRSKLTS